MSQDVDDGAGIGAYDDPGVDPRLLLPFIVLAEELHFGRAARRLHLTQSALSQQIQRLERQLGVRLVERDSRRVAIAPAGHAFLGGARNALQTVAGAAREARRAGRAQTTIRIGVDIHLPEALVKRLRLFGARRPDLLVRLRIQQQDDVVSDLESGRSDLAVGWTAPPTATGGFAHAVLAEVGIHGVVRRDDPLAGGRNLPRAALVRRRLVMYRPSRETRPFYDFLLREFIAADGSRPEVGHIPVLDDAQAAMLDDVERSGGFTICVAGELARFKRPQLVGLPFEPALTTHAVIMWRGSTPPHVAADLMHFTAGWDESLLRS